MAPIPCAEQRWRKAGPQADRDQLFDKWKVQDKERFKEAKVQSSRIWEKTQTADDRQAEPAKDKKANAARRSRSRPHGGRGRSFTPD